MTKILVEIKEEPGKIKINGVEHRIFDEWKGIVIPITFIEEIEKTQTSLYYIYKTEEDLSKMKDGEGIIVRKEDLINGASFKKSFNITRMLLEIRNEYIMLPKESCNIVLPGDPITEADLISLTSFKFNIDKDLLDENTCKELWEVHGNNVRIEKKIFLT